MNLRFRHLIVAAGVFLACAATASAGPIRISVLNATAVGGTTFNYAVNVDSSLTGLGVSSYQFELTYNTSVLSFVGIDAAGTITAAWPNALANEPSPGHVVVAGIGTTDLTGTGPLVFLQFTAKVSPYTTYSSMGFVSFTFNEGTPATSTVNATITVSPPPSITVSPDYATLTKGDTQSFTAYSAVGPVTWLSTNTSVATISGAGMLTALSAGTTRVIATDSVGTVDTSGTIEVRGLKLSVRDTSVYQGQTLDLAILTTDVTGLGIISGQFELTYNQNLWTAVDIISSGTITASASAPQFQVTAGKVSVSFAGSSVLSGSGVLLIVRLQATTTTSGYSTIGFQNVLFNESLLANTQSGSASVTALSAISISPGGTQSLVKGDSLQFSASGGTGPYVWSVSDSGKAEISSTGLLTVLRGGSVVVTARDTYGSKGSSGTINLYDFRLTAPTRSQFVFAASDTTLELPLTVTSNDTGFSSFQIKITYPTYYGVVLDSIITSGTLSSSWLVEPSFSSGSVSIAAAGVNPVTSAGTLLKLRFFIPGTTQRPSTTSVALSSVQFNEGAPIPLVSNGWLEVRSTNSKPILSSKSPSTLDSLIVGQSQVFSVSVYDPDNDPLAYSWSVDDTVRQTGTSNSFNRTFSVLTSGTTVKVVFNDPFGLKDSASWTFKVVSLSVNHPPSSPITISPKNISTPSPAMFVWSRSTDPDNDAITYGLTVTGAKDTTLSSLADTSKSLSLPKGSYSWFVSASDGQVQSVSDTAAFTVPNGAPSSFTFTQPTIDTVKSYNVPISIVWTQATDPDSDTLTYLIRISGAGLDTLLSTTSDSANINSARFQPSSAYTITGKVTDGVDTVASSNSKSLLTASVLTSAGAAEPNVPTVYALSQNYPNPFNPSTTIQFAIPKTSFVTLTIFDLLGNEVERLVSASMAPGIHSVRWNAASFANGTYFYRIQAGEFVQTRKLVLLK